MGIMQQWRLLVQDAREQKNEENYALFNILALSICVNFVSSIGAAKMEY